MAATLVLLLDLQIETVATRINRYWIWLDSGPYYGVPTANFIAWWLIGLALALVVATLLGRQGDKATKRQGEKVVPMSPYLLVSCLVSRVSHRLPAYLYLLSTLMFTIVNLAHSYSIAGLVGVLVLLIVAPATRFLPAGRLLNAEARRRGEVQETHKESSTQR